MDGHNSILIDSNIAIYAAQPEYGTLRDWIQTKNISISDITRIEVLGYPGLLPESILYFEKLFGIFDVFSINEKVIQKAISLKQQKVMSLGDAIIAATALVENLALLTANTKDFKHIKELDLIGLKEIK